MIMLHALSTKLWMNYSFSCQQLQMYLPTFGSTYLALLTLIIYLLFFINRINENTRI